MDKMSSIGTWGGDEDGVVVIKKITADEQLHDRILKLMTWDPIQWRHFWLETGFFHFGGHMLHTNNRLYFIKVHQACVRRLGMEATVTQEFSMTKEAHQDRYHRDIFLPAVLQALAIIDVPLGVRTNRCLLLGAVKHNRTAVMLLHCCMDHTVPANQAKQIGRMPPSRMRWETLMLIVRFYIWSFLCVNKFLYGMLCVHTAFFWYCLKPCFQDVQALTYTHNNHGWDGHSNFGDMQAEKLNNWSVNVLGDHPTPDRIRKLVPTLNVSKHVEHMMQEALGVAEPDEVELSKSKKASTKADVDKLASFLVGKLTCTGRPRDYANLCRVDPTNHFTGKHQSQESDPWLKPRRFASDYRGGWQAYIHARLFKLRRL